jgi:hypothetical protein
LACWSIHPNSPRWCSDGGSYRLRLAEDDGHLQWVGMGNGAEKVYDSEPGVDFATKLQLLLVFPFINESLL